MKRITALLLILGAVLFGIPGLANAQDAGGNGQGRGNGRGGYPVGGATVEITGTPSQGGTITVTVRNCRAGTPVTIGFNGSPPVTVICQGSVIPGPGVATTQLTLPNRPGNVPGTVLLDDGGTIPFSVFIPTPANTVPRTGSSGLGEKTGLALGLIALGGGMLAVARTRRKTLVPA